MPNGPEKSGKNFEKAAKVPWFDRFKFTIEMAEELKSPEALKAQKAREAAEKKRLEQEGRQKVHNEVKAYINQKILPFIKKMKPELSEKQFWESDLVYKELVAILFSGYAAKDPYIFVPKPNGFVLEHDQFIPVHYRFDEFDENLNYLPKIEVFAEDEEVEEPVDEPVTKSDAERLFPGALGAVEELYSLGDKKKAQDIALKQMSLIVEKVPEIADLHFEALKMIGQFQTDYAAGKFQNMEEAFAAIGKINKSDISKKFKEIKQNADLNGDLRITTGCDLYGSFMENYGNRIAPAENLRKEVEN